jgi:hypothetical protein
VFDECWEAERDENIDEYIELDCDVEYEASKREYSCSSYRVTWHFDVFAIKIGSNIERLKNGRKGVNNATIGEKLVSALFAHFRFRTKVREVSSALPIILSWHNYGQKPFRAVYRPKTQLRSKYLHSI